MRRSLTWVSALSLGTVFLGLAAALTPASAAPHHTQFKITYSPATSRADALAMRELKLARAHLVARVAPTSYTVRSGDTLSSIARRVYGHARLWPALWWVNRHRVRNPEQLGSGMVLQLSAWHPDAPWLRKAALAAVPPPPAPAPAPAPVQGAAPAPAAPAPTQPPVAAVSAGAPGSYQACVISRESGGNPSAVNPSSGAGGLYQFLPSTWASLGYPGLPQDASVAMQNQAFAQLYAQSGSAPWSSDGC